MIALLYYGFFFNSYCNIINSNNTSKDKEAWFVTLSLILLNTYIQLSSQAAVWNDANKYLSQETCTQKEGQCSPESAPKNSVSMDL